MSTREKTIPDPIIEAVADTLANCHDWDELYLKNAFIMQVLKDCPNLHEEALSGLWDQFEAFEATTRFLPAFNHFSFVQAYFQSRA